MPQGLRIAMYHVGNLSEAKAWYTRVLDKAPYFDQPFYVGFNVGGYELGLKEVKEPTDKGASTYTYWAVGDAHKEYQRLLDLGAKPNDMVQNVGDDILVATVKDPWDNVFGIVQNPNFQLTQD